MIILNVPNVPLRNAIIIRATRVLKTVKKYTGVCVVIIEMLGRGRHGRSVMDSENTQKDIKIKGN